MQLAIRIIKVLLKYLLAVLFVGAGVLHFTNEAFYLSIMPDYIPHQLHRPAVVASGVAEIVLGVMLAIPWTSTLAAWGLIALLIAVFPANIYMFEHPDLFPDISPSFLLLRLPLQGVLIAWAYWYTLPDKPRQRNAKVAGESDT